MTAFEVRIIFNNYFQLIKSLRQIPIKLKQLTIVTAALTLTHQEPNTNLPLSEKYFFSELKHIFPEVKDWEGGRRERARPAGERERAAPAHQGAQEPAAPARQGKHEPAALAPPPVDNS